MSAARVARVERRKLLAQLPLRILAVLCVLGPAAFAAILGAQAGTPADALFGTLVHQSGFAIALVVLSFAANWGFPVLAGVLAGDLFASEDRHGTWKTILTRSQPLEDIFAGKVRAAFGFAIALGLLLAASSIVAGVIASGAHGFADFAGRPASAGRVLLLTVAGWLLCLLPLLAYTSLAIFFSVWSRNGIVGVLGPLLVALLTQLLFLIGRGAWPHLLIPGAGFEAWHGLFAHPAFLAPLFVSIAASLAWIGAALGGAWAILRGRAFVAGGDSARGWRRPVRIAVAAVAGVALLALVANLGPAGVTAPRLQESLAAQFRRLTLTQQALLGHPIPRGAEYNVVPVCRRRDRRRSGPGDWTCTMNVYVVLPGSRQPLSNTPVGYDVSAQSGGCYKAASPPGVVGPARIRMRGGGTVANPLTVIYGCFDTL